MADDLEAMQAMMAQMESAAGGPQTTGRHRKRQSNASLSIMMSSKQATIDPLTEIEDYRAEKDLLLQAYDKIDVDDNGDIEFEEFNTGMHMLNVSLSEEEVQQVFKLMDSDASNYVDRNEFTMFLTQRFESHELTRFQDAILRKLGGRTRNAGSIMNGDELDTVAIAAMERDIRGAMKEIVTEEMVILKEEEKLYQEMEKQQEEQEDFGLIENAHEWNRFEVGYWIENEVKFTEYTTNFMKAHVDGSILLSDLSREYLIHELGVKKVHIEKIMRSILHLRDEMRTEWDESECFDIIPYPILNDDRAIDRVKYLEGEVTARDQEIQDLKKEYESRIQSLLGQIAEKEGIIKQAEADGFVLNDGTDDDESSEYSADITDDDMPPLIDAAPYEMDKQQTVAFLDDIQPDGQVMTSQITERHSIVQPNDIEVDADNDNIEQNYEIVDGTENKAREERSRTVVFNPHLGSGPASPELQPTNLGGSTVLIDKMVSHSPSPNLTPSASQQQLQKSHSSGSLQSHRRKKHHRKNSTKAGFWAGTKKKPPAGTKAYWLYLDGKSAMNGNFANPIRVKSWHHHEIAWWLKGIKCDKYAVKFVDEKVSGEQLICDMNSSVLSSDLGVKMLHCGKIMREIESLKIQAGITFSIEEKVNNASYRPSNEESVTYQLQEMEKKMLEVEEKHNEELKENQEKYDELKEENDKIKVEVETLEQQVVELEKRKAKKVDSDDEDDSDYDEEDAPMETTQDAVVQEAVTVVDTTQETTENEENKDDNEDKTEDGTDAEAQPQSTATALSLPTDKIVVSNSNSSKRPKGYFRKFPKEIRKLMREIDDMERKSNDGTYGEHNKGKFGATHRAFKWKTQEVCQWLNKRGFVCYIDSFNKNGIDGEILVNDLNPTILHEDLAVKRFHTGKMLREIQALRHGGLYTECDHVVDIGYDVQFCAVEELDTLRRENKEMKDTLTESEQKVEELINRPQIAENEKIVEIAVWDDLVAEKARLATQVDEYEEKIDDLKHQAVPEQEKAEAKNRLLQFNKKLAEMKENDANFANVIKVRQWNTNEVCWFFDSIGLGDYISGIREQKINGEILIEDISPELLSRDIGVKRIHINQIIRQVEDLRHKAFGYEEDEDVIDIVYVPQVYATDKYASYQEKIEGLENDIKENIDKYNELNTKHEALGEEKEGLIKEKNDLLQNIDTLNKDIQELKDAQLQEMEDTAKAKIEELEGEIGALNKTVNDNQSTYDEEKKQMETAHQEVVEEKETNINDLNTKIEGLESSLTEANEKIDEYVDKERQQREEEEAKDNSYEAQLRRMAKDDATFGVPKRAHKWTIEEVSHWLYTIKIPEYVDTFKDGLVDGAILLSDLSAEQLRSDLQIKQYHIGKITREIGKLKELAVPPLSESDIIDLAAYVPEKPAVEVIAELKGELTDQQDINSALNMEVQNLKDQYETIKEIQAMGAAIHDTPGGPNDSEVKDELDDTNAKDNTQSNANNVAVDQLTKENAELNAMLEYLQKSKIDLAMNTANEMQKLRRMVRIASQAYEELTGTPLGQVAQWQGTQNFFYNTLGYSPKKPPNNHYR